MANKILIPAAVAAKFPTLEVSYSDGKTFKLPIGSDGDVINPNKTDVPKATLLCLSFRASSQVCIGTIPYYFICAYCFTDLCVNLL